MVCLTTHKTNFSNYHFILFEKDDTDKGEEVIDQKNYSLE